MQAHAISHGSMAKDEFLEAVYGPRNHLNNLHYGVTMKLVTVVDARLGELISALIPLEGDARIVLRYDYSSAVTWDALIAHFDDTGTMVLIRNSRTLDYHALVVSIFGKESVEYHEPVIADFYAARAVILESRE